MRMELCGPIVEMYVDNGERERGVMVLPDDQEPEHGIPLTVWKRLHRMLSKIPVSTDEHGRAQWEVKNNG